MATQSESVAFKLSKNMIYHAIFSQSGTVGKAVAELAMNAFDAGSAEFHVNLSPDGFKAWDHGRGFETKDQINDWFATLGFDHSSEMHQDEKRFSRFGLGRGQIMAFASTEWRTRNFLMEVDFKGKGDNFDLTVDLPNEPGCCITGKWYDPLGFADMKEVEQEIVDLLEYVEFDVYLNGKSIKKKVKWDVETDRIKLKRSDHGGLKVYNKGVLIRTYPSYQYGSGVAVSKVNFTLNMARNDILQSKCLAWREVKKFLQADATDQAKKKTRLSDEERRMMARRLLDGDVEYKDIRDTPLLTDITGRKWPLKKLESLSTFTVFTGGPKAHADRLQQSKAALVLSKDSPGLFVCDTVDEFVAVLDQVVAPNYSWSVSRKFRSYESLVPKEEANYLILSQKELSKTEKIALKSIGAGFHYLSSAVSYQTGVHGMPRNLFLGESNSADAWTDGATYIVLNRRLVRDHIRDGVRGITTLANVLVHELCHDVNTAGSHEHGSEFFELFHDVLTDTNSGSYGTSIRVMFSKFIAYSQKEGLKISKNEAKDLDREVECEREVYGTRDILDEMEACNVIES